VKPGLNDYTPKCFNSAETNNTYLKYLNVFNKPKDYFSVIDREMCDKYQRCPNGLCCSKRGKCGTDFEHCLASNGCQSNCKYTAHKKANFRLDSTRRSYNSFFLNTTLDVGCYVQACVNVKKCMAVTFDKLERMCYLFDALIDAGNGTYSPNHVSYFKINSMAINVQNGLKLTNHFKSIRSRNNIECLMACREEKGCDAISFDKNIMLPNETVETRMCYFFRRGQFKMTIDNLFITNFNFGKFYF
jgi:hypothetical protein